MPGKRMIKYKRPYKKKSTDAKQNKAIKTLKKKVKALEAPIELKYQYSHFDLTNLTPTVTSNTLNLIRPWDSSSLTANNSRLFAREGDTICMKNYLMNGIIRFPYDIASPTRETATRVRMIYVYYPDEPPGSNINDILETGLVATGADIVDCFYKRNGRLKFKILKDVTYSLDNNYYNWTNAPSAPVTNSFSGLSSTRPNTIQIKHRLDLSKLPGSGKVQWNDALAVPRLGQVVLFLMTDNQDIEMQFNATGQITWHDQ